MGRNKAIQRICTSTLAGCIFLTGMLGLSAREKPVKARQLAPVFSVPGGLFTNEVTLALSGPSPAAVIRYTLDGSEPTEASTNYSTPDREERRVGKECRSRWSPYH